MTSLQKSDLTRLQIMHLFSKAISHFKPYEVVNVVVQRKKKRLTIPVELSVWLRPYDTNEEE